MCEDDAIEIDSKWPNRHDGSLFFIKRLIKWNPNIGAYDESGKLMGWCLRLQAGPLGALQVGENFKRQGVGCLVAMAMCKILCSMGHDTFALVSDHNIVSRNLFEKLNFKRIDEAFWLRTIPKQVGATQWTD